MCTVVLDFRPSEAVPLLLLGVRDEVTERPWLPPARHWAASPRFGTLLGGLDEQAGGTWLAVHPGEPGAGSGDGRRVACLLNGRGTLAAPEARRSRGELPLRAGADGAAALKELAGDPAALAAYDPFHLVCADAASAQLLSWDGVSPVLTELPPGAHLLTNAGLGGRDPEPRAAYLGPRFAAARPPGDPARPLAGAWGRWLALADGEGLPAEDPRAIVVRRTLPDGRAWGTTSQTLVALAPGGTRYDFRAMPGQAPGEWYPVPV